MRRSFVIEFAAALSLVAVTWLVAHTYRQPALATAAATPTAVDPTLAQTDLRLRTGDSFWGMHLGGVIPCASMLVKGGGHLVMLSPQENHEARCFFHIKENKQLTFGGHTFHLEVIGPDQVHVVRDAVTNVALAN